MQKTNAKQLRAELKDYLDLASKEPLRILRRSGESYVLISEDMYAELQNEILSLQKRLLGMTEALTGEVSQKDPRDRSRLERFSKASK